MSREITDTNQNRGKSADITIDSVVYQHSIRFLSLLMTIGMVLVAPAVAHGQGEKPAGPYRLRKPIILGVGAPDQAEFPLSRGVRISPNLEEPETHLTATSTKPSRGEIVPLNLKGLREFLTADGLNWEPEKALETFDVTLRLPKRAQPNRIRVGKPGDQDIDLSVTFRSDRIKFKQKPNDRIQEGQQEPDDLEFKIEHPERIPTGVSAGDFRVRFWNPKLEPQSGFELIFPVVIYGFGRVLEDVQFVESSVRVGASASVGLNIVSIGSNLGLGGGHLRLTHHPLAGDPSEGVRLPLPLAEGEVIVPRYDHRFGLSSDVPAPDEESTTNTTPDQPAEWWAHAAWRDEAIWQKLSESKIQEADLAIPPNLVRRHTLHLHLPDSFSLGTWTGEVDWDSGRLNDAALRGSLKKTIGGGLQVSHRVGWIGDRLVFRVVSAQPLGKRINLRITYPDQHTTAEIPLTRISKEDAEAHAGELSIYQGSFPERGSPGKKLDQSGGYSASVIGLEGDVEESLLLPTTFRTCFRLETRELQRNPELTIFTGPVPFDVYVLPPAFPGEPWKTTRKAAFEIAYDSGQLKEAKVRRLPIYRVPQPDRRGPRKLIQDPKQEIEVGVTPSGKDAQWNEHSLPPKDHQSWEISAEISSKDPPNAERRQLGVRQYEQRLLLVGKDANGDYFTRMWWLPLTVRVDDDWEHHKYFVVLLAVLGVFSVAGFGFWLRSRLASRHQTPERNEKGTSFSANDDFFGDTSSANPSPTGSAQFESPVQSSPAPAKTDDDWFNS